MLERGRQALLARNYEGAIDLFNQLLLLPPTPASQDAQELIGLAWERAGNLQRARTEYELYMRLFPKGEGTDRVAQRLASLEGGDTPTPPAAVAAAAPTPRPPPRTFSGSIAQYYYGGVARSESLVNLTTGVDQQTLTRTTQSALVTSADLNARFGQGNSETRFVLRGTGATNLSSQSRNNSLLNSAYVDYRRTDLGMAVRAGRQSAISGGLIGLFDGVSAVIPVRAGIKVDLMGGVPANTLVNAPAQRLWAAMVEMDGLVEGWGGNLYILNQTVDGFVNRRALGAEVRYSTDNYSLYSLFDYDSNFKTWNAATLQATFQAPAQSVVTVFYDERKAPSLQLTNALITTGQTSLKDYLVGRSLDEARAAAVGITATARQALLSLSRPIAEHWQMGVDLRYSQIGALPAVGNFEATPATGAQVGMSAQLSGSNLYSSRDLSSFGLTVVHTPQFNGAQFTYNNLTGLRGNDLTLEPSIRLYGQKSNDGLKLRRVTPGLRVSYRLSRRASVIGESIVEFSNTDGPSGNDSIRSVYMTVGYRYEFN
ncbi:MAG: tetratricopeptide repeat protein [Aquincola sp.]|nr:tetratricopeptide repeat protein [Aquincola sp.]MDH5331175.1 tetratricopeptide repeat protein [Aquincola sp.]